MQVGITSTKNTLSHNPYFNRWFSAISIELKLRRDKNGHNPYFNRWFSAIAHISIIDEVDFKSQSLF